MASRDVRRMVAVVGGVIALVIGGSLYVLLVFQPGRDREAARAGIREWEPRWHEARACLLGGQPLAAATTDAMTARELVVGTIDAAMGDCTKVVGALARPYGASTGVDAVEAAWPRVELGIGEVAQAYAAHRARPLAPNPLPAALDRLGAAHAALRAAAGMSAPPGAGGPPAAALTPARLVVAGGEVTDLAGVTHDGVFRGRATVAGKPGGLDVTWTTSGIIGAPVHDRVTPAPDRSWSLRLETTGAGATLRAGEVVVATGADLAPLIALGAGPGRLALYATRDGLQLARSADAGATWNSVPALPERPRGESAWAATPAGDRLHLAWTGSEHVLVRSVAPDAHATGPLPVPVALVAQQLQSWCTGGALWIVGGTPSGYEVTRAGDPTGAPLHASQPRPVACDAERVVLRTTRNDLAIDHACTPTACVALPPAGAVDRVVGLAGGHVYRADSRAGLVAVWRDAEPPRFYRLPHPRLVYGVADVGGKPILLLLDSEPPALEYVELP